MIHDMRSWTELHVDQKMTENFVFFILVQHSNAISIILLGWRRIQGFYKINNKTKLP